MLVLMPLPTAAKFLQLGRRRKADDARLTRPAAATAMTQERTNFDI